MPTEPIDDALARDLRRAWFRYLDTIVELRPSLHRYCLSLTRNVWDAEDLLQDTLLKGFGAIGRGDLHGDSSRVKNARAYLVRTATNLWIDAARRRRHASDAADETRGEPGAVVTQGVGEALFARATPRERAAVVLKDVFDFTVEEIAEQLSITVASAKIALHRGRAHLKDEDAPRRGTPSKKLVDDFVDAFNAKDLPRLTGLLLETITIEVPGVGGGRGNKANWASSSLQHSSSAERFLYEGEPIAVVYVDNAGERMLGNINRFEEDEGRVSRVRSYVFCPETMAVVSTALGLPRSHGLYHQAPDVLENMIATTGLPWNPW